MEKFFFTGSLQTSSMVSRQSPLKEAWTTLAPYEPIVELWRPSVLELVVNPWTFGDVGDLLQTYNIVYHIILNCIISCYNAVTYIIVDSLIICHIILSATSATSATSAAPAPPWLLIRGRAAPTPRLSHSNTPGLGVWGGALYGGGRGSTRSFDRARSY